MANFAVSPVDTTFTVQVGENTAAAAAFATDAAQSAAYAGGFETPEYATQSAGDAATTPGQIFRVPLGTSPQTFNWFRRLLSGSEAVSPLATSAVLAGAGGAALVGFQQSGAGATPRTVQAKLRDTVSVKDFRAVGDGVADDTAKIQAAIDAVELAGGGAVYFPNGIYRLTSALTVDSAGVCLVGQSRWGCLLLQSTLSARIVNMAANFCNIRSLSFIYDGTPISGATAIYVTGAYVNISDILVRSAHVACHWFGTGAVAGKLTDFDFLDFESVGLFVEGINDLFVSRFIINAGNTTRGALGGIRLADKVEAFMCTDGDILLGQYSMTMDAAVYGLLTRPAYCNFTSVYFDSATNATQIRRCVEIEFVGCWFSGGRSGGGNPGAVVENCQSIRFTNCRFFNSGGSGVLVQSTASDITFTNCKAEANSVTAGVGAQHGFAFSDNTTQFQLIGCTASNGLFTGQQGYGIFVGAGCDQFRISDCNLVGNATGPILDGTSNSADKIISGNIGYRTSNRGQAVIATGNTTVVVNHGLNVTPDAADIQLTRGSSNASSVDLFAGSITSTQFTINTAPAPSSDITVNWSVRSKGA